jgi:hypothetical protein
MGFYSVFSLVAGMGTTVLMAFMTERALVGKAMPRNGLVSAAVLAIFSLAFMFGILPLLGMHRYKYISPICYYDWYETSHSVLLLLWTAPVLCAGTALLAKCAWHKSVMFSHLIVYFVGWCLWPVATVIGLADVAMPEHMMIAGAVLGHGQALINPILYGVVWNSTFPDHTHEGAVVDVSSKVQKVEDIDAA